MHESSKKSQEQSRWQHNNNNHKKGAAASLLRPWEKGQKWKQSDRSLPCLLTYFWNPHMGSEKSHTLFLFSCICFSISFIPAFNHRYLWLNTSSAAWIKNKQACTQARRNEFPVQKPRWGQGGCPDRFPEKSQSPVHQLWEAWLQYSRRMEGEGVKRRPSTLQS